MGVNDPCLANPSLQCDQWVQDYCNKNPNDQDFCGCSTNMLKDAPDPALGRTPVKCWSDKCNKNANSYKFFFVKDEKCPDVCVDESSITALGSTITGSSFNQSSCGGAQNIQTQDPKVAQSVTKLYTYGIGTIIAFVVILLCISMSMSLILFIK
jgi:hypothetical protein